MRIISYNVNGLRAAISKGFFDWLKTDPADVVCLQETKAQKEKDRLKKSFFRQPTCHLNRSTITISDTVLAA